MDDLWPNESWPNLDPVLLLSVQKIFKSPLNLQAAFECENDCYDLIADLFPDLVDEAIRNSAAELVRWQVASAPAFKRLRLAAVSKGWYGLPSSSRSSLDLRSSYALLSQSSSITVLELASKKKQRKYRDEVPDVRARKVDEEKRKYCLLLANVIKQAGLPIVQLVNSLDDPSAGWFHLFAGRRSNTLKNRYKSWKPFQVWLELHRGRTFPTSCKDIIDYMQCRVDDDCGKTVPESFSVALNLLEVLGRVPEDQQLSKDPLWIGHVKSWTAEISADSAPRKPAEMYTISMLLALELTVEDEAEPMFIRALSWVVLVMVWAALRCDDVQAVLPHRSQFSGLGLRRDYLVMEPKKDWLGVRRKFLPPADLSSLIRKLLGALRIPQFRGGRWELGGAQLLLPDGLEMHFSGHSPRNFLTSVVFKLQTAVNRAIVEGRDEEYHEDEALDSLCKAAESSGANPNRIRKRHAVMNALSGRHCLGLVYPTLVIHEDDWALAEDPADIVELPVLEDDARKMLELSSRRDTAAESSKYFVTVSRRTGHRRLHLMGCFVKPSKCCEVRLCNSVTADDFDSICRACRKRMIAETGRDAPEESSSTASSSSTPGQRDDED
ncbi:Uncharacterized protein SCF082_LOCUS12985 [Durusdinium trenchii]|uniref:Uncharacterized protein n=1 Tax=Durusdinium trenchii TaxID=1381693 RepID=A0ABP0JNH2_9DINO